jgi:hypothetical protein
MKFDKGIANRYTRSVEEAFAAILDKGNDEHRRVARSILASEMLVRVLPVSKVNASGVTGLINAEATNEKIADGSVGLIEALGEVHITIAEETIDTGGQRGCEGTFVHEGRHAFDFARVIESFSDAAVNPLSIFDPTLFELEWEAHRTSGDYMLCVDKDEYIHEGIGLMILGRKAESEPCYVDTDGIARRLRESYGLEKGTNEGPYTSRLLGLKMK